MNNLFPLPDVITNLVFSFCDPFKEEHQRKQGAINQDFYMYARKRNFDLMTLELSRGFHKYTEIDVSYPNPSSIAKDIRFFKVHNVVIAKCMGNYIG